MGRMDLNALRYLTKDDLRTLQAVEQVSILHLPFPPPPYDTDTQVKIAAFVVFCLFLRTCRKLQLLNQKMSFAVSLCILAESQAEM